MSGEPDFGRRWTHQDMGQQAATARRRVDAVKLRIAGATYSEIARQLGYADKASAFKDIQRALEQARQELEDAAAVLRTLEVARLDQLTLALWGQAMAGDVKSVDAIRRLSESRRRLLGIDAPERHEHFTLDAVDAEIVRLEGQLARAEDADRRDGSAGTPALPA